MGKKKRTFTRFTALTMIMIIFFSVIVSKLFWLQIIDADQYIAKANVRAVRQIAEYAPRGKIMDSKGAVLATNKQSYMIVYIEPESGEADFFPTFKKVFKYIDCCTKKGKNDQLLDEFQLKAEPYRFEFPSPIEKVKRAQELHFKKDRGMQKYVEKRLFGKTRDYTNLTEIDKDKINKALLDMSAEETFDYLVFKYDLYKLLDLSAEKEKQLIKEKKSGKITNHQIKEMLLKNYSVCELRKYIVIKDQLRLQSYSTYRPITIATNVSKDLALIFQQVKSQLPGIDVKLQPIRYYPKESLGSNFIGYISKIPKNRSKKI